MSEAALTGAPGLRLQREETTKVQGKSRPSALYPLMRIVGYGISAVGGLAIIAFSAHFWDWSTAASVASVAAMVAIAGLLSGGLLGFLFGIPRVLATDAPMQTDTANGTQNGDNGDAAVATRYGQNTNLEQISDWLTKILVGVGLTQIGSIAAGIERASDALEKPLGGAESSGAFGVVLGLAYLISGFLLGYLWTRIYLPGALRWSDNQVGELKQQISEVSKEAELKTAALTQEVDLKTAALTQQLDQIQQQQERDRLALDLMQRQLSPPVAGSSVSQSELDTAIQGVSPQMKSRIFEQTYKTRHDNWQTDKAAVERTIPVWKALIAAGEDHWLFRYHGNLGYALKDKEPPDYTAALEQLDVAIKLRDDAGIHDWFIHEFNRAFCLIKLDPGFTAGTPTDAQTKDRIVADLVTASSEPWIVRIVTTDQTVSAWMQQNGVTIDSLNPT